MTINGILSFLHDQPITHTKAWVESEAHYIRLYFGTSLSLKPANKENFDIENIFSLMAASVGFDSDDKETCGEVKKVLRTLIDGHSFYESVVDSEYVLTFTGGNALTVFIDLPQDSSLAEGPIFSTDTDVKAVEKFTRLFFTGQLITDMQAIDDVNNFSSNDKVIRFALSNGLLFEANNFELEIPKQNKFIRYTPENGIEERSKN